MELGEHIELIDFSEEPAEIIIIKKIVGNHVKHLTERISGFERLTLTHKSVSATKHEVHGKLVLDNVEYFAENADHNLFFALDACLKKLDNQLRR